MAFKHKAESQTNAEYLESLRHNPEAFILEFRHQLGEPSRGGSTDFRVIRMAPTVIEEVVRAHYAVAARLADLQVQVNDNEAVRLLQRLSRVLNEVEEY